LSLKAYLESKYPGRLNIRGLKDIETTGNFDVVLLNTNQTLHSKKNVAGHGRCESQQERDRLCKFIGTFCDYLEKKKAKGTRKD
jgi:hypothetical protein